MRRTSLVMLVPTATLALVACGGGGGGAEEPTAAPTTTAADESPVQIGRPSPGECVELPQSPDGSYQIADAGTLVMTIEDGDRLVLGEVSADEGWEAEVVQQEDRNVEVEFRKDDLELDFEAVREDDGSFDFRLCDDDD